MKTVQYGKSERSLFSVFILIFIILTVLHGAVLFFIYRSQYSRNFNLLVEYQENMILLEYQKISSEIQSALEKLSLLELAVERSLVSGQLPDSDEYALYFKGIGEGAGQFSVIRLISLEGFEVFRMNFDDQGRGCVVPRDKLQDKKDRYYFQELKEGDESLYISPLDLNIENYQLEIPYNPVIRFGRSLFDEDGNPLAFLILNYRAQLLLDDLGNHALLPQNHFSTYLLNNEGFWLKGPDPFRDFGFMHEGLEEETVAHSNPELWVHLQVDKEGLFSQDGNLYVHRTLHLNQLIKPEWGRYISRRHQGDISFYLVYFTSRDVMRKMSMDIVRALFIPFFITQVLITLIAAVGVRGYGAFRKSRDSFQLLSCLDELTECLNSSAGKKILDKTRSLVHRRNSVLTVVYVDPANLRTVRDGYGSNEGDRYLLSMVGVVRQQLRNSDFLIRLDNEGFLMILPDCGDEKAGRICSRIQEKIKEMNESDVYPFEFKLNMGLLESDREKHHSAEQLIEEARSMMEMNKRAFSGGGQ